MLIVNMCTYIFLSMNLYNKPLEALRKESVVARFK